MGKVKVAIIGTGFGAKVHAPIFQYHPDYEVVALSSVTRGRIEETKKATGVANVYSDWRAMLDREEIDLVSIVSAPYLHHDMVLEAFQKGYHVLCEKPMAFDAHESLAMIEARNKTNKKGYINFEWRFLPARLKIKEIIEQGRLGKIMHIHYTCSLPGYENAVSATRGWLGQKDKAGGMLGALGSHMLDSLMWWTGNKISSVSGQLYTYVSENHQATTEREIRTADDSFQVIGDFENGTSFHMGLVSTSRHGIGWRLEMMGTEGTLVMTEDNLVVLGLHNAPLEKVELVPSAQAPEHLTQPAARYYNAFYPMLEQLILTLRDQVPESKIATFEDGHRVQLVMDAIRHSAETGQRTQLTY